MIEITNLTKIFKGELLQSDKKALDGLSFKLRKGTITGFLGHNGSGKTTMLKIAMGFISATSGSVSFDRELGKTKKEIFRNIGYLPERPYFYPHLTGQEFLNYMVDLTGVDRTRAMSLIDEYGERLSINSALTGKLKGYSKGMLQRIGFLANIICEPKFIILDEPLSGLDPIGRKTYKEIIKELNGLGATVFFSSHIVHDIEEVSRDLVIIENGSLVYSGEMEKLYNKNKKTDFKIKYFKDGAIEHINCSEIDMIEKISQLKSQNFQIYEISRENMSLEETVYRLSDR